MATTSRTSFVIATRDRSDELCGVLRRLLDTTDSPVIVVDNASRDDSVAAAQRVAAAAAGRVVVVALDRNEGAVARNIGVARAGTPYVAFCDDDSWWEPGAVALAEELFDKHPSVAVLAARTVMWPGGRVDPFVAALANSPLGHDPALPGPSVLGFQACAALVRKSAFEAVGGFSPILHFRGEEGLLAWDLAAAGWDLCFCDALVAHHQPSTVRSPSRAQHARVLRNDALSAYLRRPVDRCARATVTLARAAVRDAAYGRALLEAAAALPAALRERRRLPDEVERSVRMLENA
ncbi:MULTISPECIES: glycosyltransferase family 2 protein [unclassified Mycobacterium]|uniref:glycosyltransferase family 2 protein n=1 Tax=unclassified Mycobacterium TaxID=2642494 RepID=UPI0007FDCA5D|nr:MULTISPECIES: glycosyltransferase [unclassified Mycobacterium]OBG73793.1 transferase [Mycobacterium sp. E1214]OBH22399.1 transferase [Mycobacterium sp. E1319]